MAYPAELVTGTLLLAVIFVVFVWPVAYGDRPSVAGLSLRELLTYLVVTEAIIMGTPRTWRAMQHDIRSGDVAITLARPLDYLGFHFAQYLGETAVRVPLAFTVGGVIVFARVGGLAVDTRILPVAVVVLLLALVLNFLLEALVGLGAFWSEDAGGYAVVVTMLRLLAGGVLLPLELMPAWVARVASWLPFPYIVYGPARVFVSADPQVVSLVLVGQLTWLLLLGAIVRLLYGAVQRRVFVQGAEGMGSIGFIATYWRANLAAHAEYRFSFVMQAASIVVSNSTWVAFWALFFQRFPEVRGWTFRDMVAMWSVAAGGVGLTNVLGAGVMLLPRLIEQGGLDLYLTHPKPVLLHVLVSRMNPFAVGDVLWAGGAFLLLYPWRPADLAVFAALTLCVAAVVTSVLTIFGSAAFWLGRSQGLQEQTYASLIQFATWPPTAYPAEVRLLLYTLLPALLVGAVPAWVLRTHSWTLLLYLVLASGLFGLLAVVLFSLGLRRYESGNRVTLWD